MQASSEKESRCALAFGSERINYLGQLRTIWSSIFKTELRQPRGLPMQRREFTGGLARAVVGGICLDLHFIEQGRDRWCLVPRLSRVVVLMAASITRCRRLDSMLSQLTCAGMVSPTGRMEAMIF